MRDVKKDLVRLFLYSILSGLFISLLDNGFLHADYVCTAYTGGFFLAIAAGGGLLALLIVPCATIMLFSYSLFRYLVKHKTKRNKTTNNEKRDNLSEAILPSVLTSALLVFSLLYAHTRWLADAAFFSPAGVGVSLALLFCAAPAFFLLGAVSRRVFRPVKGVYWFLIVAALLMLLYKPYLTGALKPRRAAAGRPNFLIISVDTLRADRLGCYGYGAAKTDAIDSLAARGMLFERAYTTMPQTNPAHQSLLTGLHPRSVGVVTNFYARKNNAPALALRMRRLGYRTAAFVSGAPLKGRHTGLARGFDVYGDTFSFADFFESGLVAPIAARMPFLPPAGFERGADAVTDEALAWLRKNRRRPFFLFVHYYDPHHYYMPPPEYVARTGLFKPGEDVERLNREWVNDYCGKRPPPGGMAEKIAALHDAEVAYADDELARLVRFVDEKQLGGNTFVFFLSDHGEGLSDHRDCLHGYDLYEEQVRVPLIVRGPGVPPASRAAAPAQLIDIFPTALSLLNANVSKELPGKDLKKTLLGGKDRAERTLFMETVYIERGGGKPRYVPRAPVLGAVSLRYKYIYHRRDGETEFYDLARDPRELKNFRSSSVSAALARETARWDAAAGAAEFKTTGLSPDMARKLRALGYIK